MSDVDDRLAALEAIVALLNANAVRTNELSAVERAADNYQAATGNDIGDIQDDINKIKQKLTILLGTSPDAGAGEFVTTSSMSSVLRTYDNQRVALAGDIGSIQNDIAEIERKLSILAMQIDPVIAGTCIMMHGANDGEVTEAGVAYVVKKRGRIIRNDAYYFQKLHLRAELKDTGGGTAYLGVFINGVEVMTMSTGSAAYVPVSDNWNWAGLSNDTWYLIEFKLRSDGGTAINRALDVIATKPGAYTG